MIRYNLTNEPYYNFQVVNQQDQDYLIQYHCEHSLLGLGRYETFLISSATPIYPATKQSSDFEKRMMDLIYSAFDLAKDKSNSDNRRFFYEFR